MKMQRAKSTPRETLLPTTKSSSFASSSSSYSAYPSLLLHRFAGSNSQQRTFTLFLLLVTFALLVLFFLGQAPQVPSYRDVLPPPLNASALSFRLRETPTTPPSETEEEKAERLAEAALMPSLKEVGNNTVRQRLVHLHRRFMRYLELRVPAYDPERVKGRGIVISGGGKPYLPFVYSSIRHLRHTLNCTLPIEIWTLREETPTSCFTHFKDEFTDVKLRVMDDVQWPVSAKDLLALLPAVRRWYFLKVFAILASSFQEVIVLDPDSVPMENPELLFNTKAYTLFGNMFWTDSPPGFARSTFFDNTGFNKVWTMETESGQIVLDKRRTWKGLFGAWFLNKEARIVYSYLLGDKDTFPIGFDAAGITFYQVQQPMSKWGGYMDGESPSSMFFTTFVHYNPETGNPAFFHHVSMKRKKELQQQSSTQQHDLIWSNVLDYSAEGFDRQHFKQLPFELTDEVRGRLLHMPEWVNEASLRFQDDLNDFQQTECVMSALDRKLTRKTPPRRKSPPPRRPSPSRSSPKKSSHHKRHFSWNPVGLLRWCWSFLTHPFSS
ncbi:hypothetical protein QOT17_018628 [Balamuthia mandrillaris]